ncbi:nickel/cobalt efflux transporter [Paraburkholderia tropica]|uniref:Nickel/cobalt efflux system n=1 Tax=Paraburkholderia tropica TaxID=92647 RepID=A0A1A5XIJ2_9BURK|nr:nickel/cobalt efflux transporter [Paraburkholderia tropica]MBB2979855.1 ABC-type nickel/cobalt efflux system permease component RcnA [Paraburkholderia tropica]OBR53321.1 nickel/cobalt efflux protein RcnA [Paraburkholderia tropica]QNB15866.1 nickel/cobalt efflux transporter RcnA [Paraburkholderia tropica]RQN39339.1 nickel/cobalt efflux transporter RcnA [Paraburkholderia tropica]SEJ69472.1 ABC-type nickel/cobalt efflux system, permease component RcnA [Paraburkholderia tropica]
MMDFSHLLSQGASSAWLFIPSAILLGALHGLEPGHSKTMMAAFIVAIRGTVGQAVLLGLSATLSHTAVVWAIALIGMYFGRNWNAASSEPWFQVASAVLIVGVAAWMIWRTWREQRAAHEHEHGHAHGHHHHDHDHHDHDHHGHDHHHADLDASSTEYQDAHERAHANDIRRRFANRDVTTGQIVMFGLTGGLVPCPASITVLLLCLQLKRFALGASLVLCFSIGLALTMVVSGTLAALSVKHVSKKWSGFGDFARKAPYFSGALILLVGLIVGYQGLTALAA